MVVYCSMYAQFFTHLILWSFGFFLQLSLLTQFKTWQQLLTHTNLQWHWNGIHRPMLDIQEMSLTIRFVSGTRRGVATMMRMWMDLPILLSSQESQGSDHWLRPLLKWGPALVMVSVKSGGLWQHLLVCKCFIQVYIAKSPPLNSNPYYVHAFKTGETLVQRFFKELNPTYIITKA